MKKVWNFNSKKINIRKKKWITKEISLRNIILQYQDLIQDFNIANFNEKQFLTFTQCCKANILKNYRVRVKLESRENLITYGKGEES